MAFRNYTHYTATIREYRLCSIVTFDKLNSDECMQSLLDTCREILSTVEGFTNFSISIGISNPHCTPIEIANAYKEAEKALTVNFYNSNNSSLSTYSNQINALSKEERSLTNSYLELIMKQVQEGPQEALKSSILELFEKLSLNKQPIDYIKSIGIHLCFSFETLLSNFDLSIANSVQGGNNIYKDIFESNAAVYLSEMLVNVATSVLNQLSSLDGKSNIIIKKVYVYINENYKNNIILQNLADYVHTNSSYLSRLFKKETGSTITDAINKVRLEKAKELLANSDLKTYEVAVEVGIPDPSYFSVIFKKYTGISPKDFSRKLI
jgi:two-component system response regulator YesN